MAISANDMRKGMVILHEGNPVKVMEFHHHTPGNLRAMVQARLRNLVTGNSFEYRFRSNDTLEKITLEQHKMEWLLAELAKTDCPMSCPHGRPVVLRYSMKDIQRAFKRI